MKTTAAILQSSYIPWKGYFDLMRHVDVLVLYDDVQYTRRDWRNRNLIKTPHGPHWLTIPVNVKGQFHQRINEVAVADANWANRHWQTISMSYAKAPGFAEHGEAIKALLDRCAKLERLSEINQHLIEGLAQLLGVQTPLDRSDRYDKVAGKNENLIHLCKSIGATRYISGPSAEGYINPQLFSKAGIEVQFFDYSGYPEYPQLHGAFNHQVSAVDLLLHTGSKAPEFLIRK